MGSRCEWVLALVVFCGCADEGDARACTLSYEYGLGVVVTGGAASGCEFEATITEGSYTETLKLEPQGEDCGASGAGERPGTYELVVTSGAETVHSSTVVVPSDGCHPEWQLVVIDAPLALAPAEACTALGESCDEDNPCPPRFACQGMPSGSVCAPAINGRETTNGGTDCAMAECPDAYPECLVYASPGIGYCVTQKERACACDLDVDRGTFVCE